MATAKQCVSNFYLLMFLLVGVMLTSAVQAEQTVTYYHTDALGSVVAASDEAGNLVWRKSYSPYGEKLSDGESGENKVSYTGKKHNEVTGLTYFGARYYDPEVGRFMGMDAVGFEEGNPMTFNRYAYAFDNPFKFIDPDGRSNKHMAPMLTRVQVQANATATSKGQLTVATRPRDLQQSIKNNHAESKMRATKGATKSGDTLKPGKFAKESIPAHRGRSTASEQRKVNDLMEKNGCHTCGTKIQELKAEMQLQTINLRKHLASRKNSFRIVLTVRVDKVVKLDKKN